jgi:hypothetical protein
VFAGPASGGAATPTFRSLVSADIPALSYVSSVTASSPLFSSGGLNPNLTIQVANSTQNGYLSSSDWTTFNSKQAAGNYITALTGDGTASGPGSAALTLATVNSNVGLFGSSTQVGTFTVNGKGLVTAASNTSIQIAESQVTNLVSDLAGKQPTGNYITALTGDVAATGPGSVAATIQPLAITNSKIANSTIDLTAKVTGILPVANGGTGLSSPGTSGNVLTSNGTTWVSSAPAGGNYTVTSKTANYTLTSTDQVVTVDGTGGSFTLTLPVATGITGKVYILKRVDMNPNNPISVIIAGGGSETIDGYTTIYLQTQNESYTLFSDGSNWKIQDHKCITPWTQYSVTIGSEGPTPPTKGTTTLDNAQWRRTGDSIEINYGYAQTSGGSSGSVARYLIPLPFGLQVDTGKFAVVGANSGEGSVGDGGGYSTATGNWFGKTYLYDSQNIAMLIFQGSTFTDFGVSGLLFGDPVVQFSLNVICPIVNWME